MSLSQATKKAFAKIGKYKATARGGIYWTFKGERLLDRRDRLNNEATASLSF